jgi:kinesin family protein 1
MFKQLWRTIRIVHSTVAIFSIVLKPSPSKRAIDLWRLDSQHQYVKGEEDLEHWSPRGVTLIQDFLAAKRRSQRITEVEAAKASLSPISSPAQTNGTTTPITEETTYTPEQRALLTRTLALWAKPLQTPSLRILSTLTSPPDSPPCASPRPPKTSLRPTIAMHLKNPLVLKSGPLLTPSPSTAGWLRRHAELRPPYLHIYSVPESEEVDIINLRNATVDAQPEIGRILQSSRVGVGNVFAVYGMGGSWLMAVRNEGVKAEWILAIDRSFLGGSASGSGSEGW